MRYVEIAPGEVKVTDGEPPVAPPGWARVRVLACGLCGSDLRLARGMALPKGVTYPLRPGHEVAGVIESMPERAPVPLEEGELVVLHPLSPCGQCVACLSGHEQRCPNAKVLGIHEPGGMAELVVWPLRRMLGVPGMEAPQAALLTDAVSTAFHALRLAALPATGRLCVIGAGGVGEQVLRVARALVPAATLAAVVRSEASASRIDRLGVLAVTGLEGAAERLRRDGGRFDAVVDFSGAQGAAAEAVRMLAPGGRLVIGSVGDASFELRTTISGVATRELQVLGCYVSTLADLRAVIKLARSGRLDLSGAVSELVPLAEAPQTFERLERRTEGFARLVLQP
ncbi:MAG TPA: alcohol dehydrogenase catalytic domain-containing protein [Candidatus Dormibacteraeota bacterium]|nr:alcohol dehydrogenase catalytic domain-containing protein [Candidatus Dormibacteraeota bacterium]